MPTLTLRKIDETAHARRLTGLLTARYADRHSAEHVAAVVADAHQRLAAARLRTFVPILAERIARDSLEPPRSAPGAAVTHTPPADAADKPRRPPTIRILLGPLIFLGVMALAGGIEMLLFPTGNDFLPRQWLDDIPVIDSWLLPGLVLGGGFGVGSLLTAYALRRRWAWWWPGTILLGVGMIVWIPLEVLFLPHRSLLEAIYGTVGVLLVALPVTASARRHRSQAHVTAGLG